MKRALLLAIPLALFCSDSKAAITTYTSLGSWQAALAGGSTQLTEPFNAGGLQAFTLATITSGTSAIGPARGVLTGSVWNGQPSANGTTFTFSGSGTVFGIGATWDTTPGGEGTGVVLVANLSGGGTTSVGTFSPLDNAFLGFVSTVPITGVSVTGASENYDVDNLIFGGTSLVGGTLIGTPVPSSWLLMLVGLGLGTAYLTSRRFARG